MITPLSSVSSASSSNILVVGGGVGGLAIASRLQASSPSLQVTILEKNECVGGRMGSFDVSIPPLQKEPTKNDDCLTFRHERGPSLLLLPDIYQDLFRDTTAASTAADYGLEIKPCLPAYQVVFDDGDCLSVGFPQSVLENHDDDESTDLRQQWKQSQQQMNRYETNGAAKWDDYLQACEAYLDCGLPNFIEERLDLASFPRFLATALGDGAKAWPLKAHSQVLDALFESPKMRALASFQDLYVGLEPYSHPRRPLGGVWSTTAPAVFGLLSAIELHPTNPKCGVFAPVGGFRAVADSLQALAEDVGVQTRVNTTVTRVTPQGVHCRDSHDPAVEWFESADYVVVNADLPYATKSLLLDDGRDQKEQAAGGPASARYDWDDEYLYSSGVIAFHWSVSKALDDLKTHNVFMSVQDDSKAEDSWSVLRDNSLDSFFADGDSNEETPFNFYVHRATATDPTAAPEGMDAIMVLVPCPTLQRDPSCASMTREDAIAYYKKQFNDDLVSNVRQRVLKRLSVLSSLEDLEEYLLHEVVDTPATYADQYNVAAGTPFALSHGLGQLSVFRPGPFSAPPEWKDRVCFCGASSRPGNGVPLVLLGAKLVAEKLRSKLKLQ